MKEETQNNTVTIDLDLYNELRDFKIGIESGETYVVHNYVVQSRFFNQTQFVTADVAVLEILELNKLLSIENEALKHFREFTIPKIKNMSIWELLEFRKILKTLD